MIPALSSCMDEQQYEPWRHYYDEFRNRVARVPPNAFDRATLLYEAAHDAYQTSTDHYTSSGWDPERALMLGRMFGTVVKQWVDRGDDVVEHLESELQRQYERLRF